MRIAPRQCLMPLAAWCVTAVLCLVPPQAQSQGMDHHQQPSTPSSQLTLRGPDGKSLTLSPADLASMPHKTISVMNAHTKTNETYSGIPLSDLLAKVGAPQGESVKGPKFMLGVVATGTDNYSVLFALAEVDPSIHTGDVIVADSMGGQPLGKDGAFKLVSSEEKRPARWVRNLATLSVVDVSR